MFQYKASSIVRIPETGVSSNLQAYLSKTHGDLEQVKLSCFIVLSGRDIVKLGCGNLDISGATLSYQLPTNQVKYNEAHYAPALET